MFKTVQGTDSGVMVTNSASDTWNNPKVYSKVSSFIQGYAHRTLSMESVLVQHMNALGWGQSLLLPSWFPVVCIYCTLSDHVKRAIIYQFHKKLQMRTASLRLLSALTVTHTQKTDPGIKFCLFVFFCPWAFHVLMNLGPNSACASIPKSVKGVFKMCPNWIAWR